MADLPPDRHTFTNVGSTTASFALLGGVYGVDVVASFGGGNVTLQKLSQDGSTYVSAMAPFTSAAYASANLARGTYRLSITTATAVYAQIERLRAGN